MGALQYPGRIPQLDLVSVAPRNPERAVALEGSNPQSRNVSTRLHRPVIRTKGPDPLSVWTQQVKWQPDRFGGRQGFRDKAAVTSKAQPPPNLDGNISVELTSILSLRIIHQDATGSWMLQEQGVMMYPEHSNVSVLPWSRAFATDDSDNLAGRRVHFDNESVSGIRPDEYGASRGESDSPWGVNFERAEWKSELLDRNSSSLEGGGPRG
jgi:hypothetical protein